MPTGSGKTWVQGLLAKYFCTHGKRVAIIEPNLVLTEQTIEKVGLVHFNLTVLSMADFYQYGC
jgi:reverse gyrase